MKTVKLGLGLITLSGLLSGCYVKHSQPYYSYAPDMHYSAAFKAQKEGAMRPLPPGAIPRGFRPYSIVSRAEAKGNLNPLPRSKENLMHGKELFNAYCVVCHGSMGEGDGPVAALPNWPRPLFPRPPSLQSDNVRDMKDGELFHIMTMGQNLMPSYGEKLSEDERWAVAHYIRALYRAKHPTEEDMKKAKGFVEDNL